MKLSTVGKRAVVGSFGAAFVIIGAVVSWEASPLREKTLKGVITANHDGDTIKVLARDDLYTVRIDRIDCPELDQEFGQAAKGFVEKNYLHHRVIIRWKKKDGYGRIIGDAEVRGVDLGSELVEWGLAWHYTQYDKSPELAKLESKARRYKRGLWSEPHPTAPWDHRRAKKESKGHESK